MPEQPSPLSEENATEIFRQLRQKEGNWVEWGKSCQQLQKAGYNTQTIFEKTGFEPIHQNQVIVASQVYETIAETGVEDQVKEHFRCMNFAFFPHRNDRKRRLSPLRKT